MVVPYQRKVLELSDAQAKAKVIASGQIISGVRCVLIDPPDKVPGPDKGKHLQQATEMHEVYPPLGLAYIAAVLRQNGADARIIDARSTDLSYQRIAETVKDLDPDFVGIHVITSKINNALYLSRRIKEVRPSVLIILGGPHIHFEHKEIINNEAVDFCARGEGEFTALELIHTVTTGGNLEQVEGITFKREGKVIVNPDRLFVKDLDAIPFPARDLLPNPVYGGAWTQGKKFSSMLATRGCPFHCQFCDAPAIWGRNHRRRSVENVLDELEEICGRFEVKYVRFVDDLLVANRDWGIKLCRGIVERGLDKTLVWSCDGRVGLMSEELLRTMKEANCQVIFYGVEFGNQRILDFCKKGFKIPQIRETINMTTEAGISSYGYFMMGYPTETIETIEDTIALAKDLALNHGMDGAGFSIVTPFPGTGLYQYCKENNLLKITDWSQYSYQLGRGVIRLKDVTDEQLGDLYNEAIYEFQFKEQLSRFV